MSRGTQGHSKPRQSLKTGVNVLSLSISTGVGCEIGDPKEYINFLIFVAVVLYGLIFNFHGCIYV